MEPQTPSILQVYVISFSKQIVTINTWVFYLFHIRWISLMNEQLFMNVKCKKYGMGLSLEILDWVNEDEDDGKDVPNNWVGGVLEFQTKLKMCDF